MINPFQEVSEFCNLSIDEKVKLPIAIVGAGGIVDGAHLPAYKKAGVTVVGIFDTDPAKAKDVANRHGIPKVYSSLDELINDSASKVVDIAVPAAAQPEIFLKVANAKKHILAQKPLATTVEKGMELAASAKENGIVAAVNQQLRFEEGIAAAYKMVEMGMIGKVTNFAINVTLDTPWHMWPWAKDLPRLEVMLHSIHYHDMIRWFLGNPTTVFCAAGRTAGQYPVGETRTISTYLYDGNLTATVHSNHMNRGGDNYALYRIDGDQGSIRGTFGLLYDYPDGRPDTLELRSHVLPTDGWLPYPVTTRWFPDAFMGTIGQVFRAVAGTGPLRSSVADNVDTLKLVDALYRSMDSGASAKF